MVAPSPDGHQEGFFATWGLVEWIIGAIWTAGIAVAGFVWRQSGVISDLSTRLEILEREAQLREKADNGRHAENVHILRGLQMQIQGLAGRIDQIYRRGRDD